jgi:MFS family permease
MAVLGATLGAMIAGNIGEVIGRKKSIIVADLLAIVGPVI